MFILLVVSDRAGPSRSAKCENPLGREAGGGLDDAACLISSARHRFLASLGARSSEGSNEPRDESDNERQIPRMTAEHAHDLAFVNGNELGYVLLS
jgi:hypothetical protein